MNNYTMPEIENMLKLLNKLESFKKQAYDADCSNRIINEYLVANPEAAKALFDRANAWNTKTVSRHEAELKICSCKKKIIEIQAAIAADRDMIVSWTKQINDTKDEILRLQKALKEVEAESAKVYAELETLN